MRAESGSARNETRKDAVDWAKTGSGSPARSISSYIRLTPSPSSRPVVKVSHRPSDTRIPGESCRPNVVEAHETGETTRALHLQSILEELDSNVIATDGV